MSLPSRSSSSPLVELVQQDAVAVEQVTNSSKKQVDVYVNIYSNRGDSMGDTFKLSGSKIVKAQLYYDCDPPKPVDYILNVNYVVTPNPSGGEVSVEIKIGILSSQHQGSLFVVILRVADTPGAGVASNPIRIVSKIDHIRKEGVSIKKPTFNEIIMDRLAYLESQQEEQIKFLHHMIDKHGSAVPSPSSRPGTPTSTPPILTPSTIDYTISPPSSPGSPNSNASTATSTPQFTTPNTTPTLPLSSSTSKLPPMSLEGISQNELESLLAKLLTAYANLEPEDRSEEIRKLVRSLGASMEASMKGLEKAFGNTIITIKEEPGTDYSAGDSSNPNAVPRGHQRTGSKGGTPITPLPPPANTTSSSSAHYPMPPLFASKPKPLPTQTHTTHTPPNGVAFSPSKSTSSIPPPSAVPKFSISPATARRNTNVESDSMSSEAEARTGETVDPMEMGNYLSRSFPLSPAISSLPSNIQQQLSPLTAPLLPPQSVPQLISPPHSMELHQQSPQNSQEFYSHQHEWHYSQPPLYHPPALHTDPETAYLLIHPQFRTQSPPPSQVSANLPSYPPQMYLPNQQNTPPAPLSQYHELQYKSAPQKVDASGTHVQEKVPISQPHPVKLEHVRSHTPPPQSPTYATPPFHNGSPPSVSPLPSNPTPPQTFPPPASYPNESFLVQQLVLELSQKNLNDQQIQHQVALYIQHLQQQQLQNIQLRHQAQHQVQQVQQMHHNTLQQPAPQSQQSQQFEFVLPRGEPASVASEFHDKWQF